MNKQLLTLLLIFLGTLSLTAEISILSTTHSDIKNGCNGTITVRATGTAGPFTIYLYDHVQEIEVERTNVNGDIVLSNLCNASYDVVVYPTRFPTCSKSMKAYVRDDRTLDASKIIDAVAKLAEGTLEVSISPNPASGPIVVKAQGLPLSENKEADWTVNILNGAGKRFVSTTFAVAGEGANGNFPLNLKGLQKGLYFVRVTRGDGAEGTAKLLLQ